tara:strand:- start:286 stop:471 length:186 start_codon:yes stop_codon:yes gene_type:complete
MEGFDPINKKAQCDWLAKRWVEEADLEELKLWAREQKYSFYYGMSTNDILRLVEEAKDNDE